MKITYSADGTPSSAYIKGGAAMLTTVAPTPGKKPVTVGSVEPNKEEGQGGTRWVPWGINNDYPIEMARDIRMNGVAHRALKIKADMLYGKRLVACKVVDFDASTEKEVVEVCTDPEVKDFLRRSNINVFRDRMIHDFVWLGNAFPILLLNADRSKISMVAHDKAAKFRYQPFNNTLGRIDNVFRSANWPSPTDDQLQTLKCIDSSQYYMEVDRVKFAGKDFKYVFPVYNYDILNDYYSTVIHESIRKNGWLANSTSIPAIVKATIKNNMSLKYHIKIPLTYWNGLYPTWARLLQKERETIVSAKLEEMNLFLTGQDNAMKAFISHYATDPQTGKEVAGWEIVSLEDKMNYDAWNNVLAAADKEIIFAAGVNPAIMGLDTPGSGGSKGGSNNGGSNIREGWLTAIASAQGERDTLHSWWNFVREYNGYDPDVELRTIDQVLTTLDQGKGTKKELS